MLFLYILRLIWIRWNSKFEVINIFYQCGLHEQMSKENLRYLHFPMIGRGSVMVKVLEFSALYFGNADIPLKGIAFKSGIIKKNQLYIYEGYWYSSGILCQDYINAL